MIICDLTHAYHPTSGGIRTYINEKRRFLLSHTDHTHVLIIPGDEDRVEREGRAWTYRVRSPKNPLAKPYRFFTSSRKLLAALNDARPDVVELNTHFMRVEQAVAFRYRDRMRAEGKAPIVSLQFHTDFARTYADAYVSKAFGRRAGRVAARLAERYIRSILRASDVVFSFSEAQRGRLAEIGRPDATVVPQGVDVELFNPARVDPSLRASLGLTPEDRLLVYVGRFDPEKHVDTLVGALEALPSAPRFFLAMAGNGPLRPRLEEQAARNPRLLVLPYQSDRTYLARLLASADVYVTAGPHEVYAFSVVEAQASGLPVVGVAAGGLPNLVPSDTGFLGPVDDSQAMAAHIVEAVTQREFLGAAARRHVEATYSWEASFDAIVRRYEAALTTAGG